MRAGPELGKKSAGVLRREGSLPGGRVCAIRLISDRVQFRLRTRSYGPRSSPDSIVHSVRFGSIFGDRVCQRKKAKQKHRNSASVGMDSRTVVGSRDWKDANSGLARIVWYAFDYRVPRVVGSQQCASTVSLSRSFRAEVFRHHPGRKEGIQAGPGPRS